VRVSEKGVPFSHGAAVGQRRLAGKSAGLTYVFESFHKKG
jgi:hypothetical protein